MNREKFFRIYRENFGALNPAQMHGLNQLLTFLENDATMADVRFQSYFLATAKHETANTFAPITELGNRKYFRKYNAGTVIGQRLGNTEPEDGWNFRGRGYVQITGRTNYQKFASLLGIDLVGNPDLALQPDTAYKIASLGMVNGSFTGQKLEYYFHATLSNWLYARKIINGMDRADLIAGYAQKFCRGLSQ